MVFMPSACRASADQPPQDASIPVSDGTERPLGEAGDFTRFLKDRFARMTPAAYAHCPKTPQDYSSVIHLGEKNCDFYSRLRNKIEIPWIACDLDPVTHDDDEVRRWMGLKGVEIEQAIVRGGMSLSCFDPHVERGRRLYEAYTRHKDDGGLGLQCDTDKERPLRNPIGVHRERAATCIEFVSSYLRAAKMNGIPAVPIQLLKDASGQFQEHVRVGIQDPQTGEVRAIADLCPGYFGKPIANETWIALSPVKYLSFVYAEKGFQEPDLELAERYANIALEMNPGNCFVLNIKAHVAALRGDLVSAKSALLEAIKDLPEYPQSYESLATVASHLGDTALKEWASREFVALTGRP